KIRINDRGPFAHGRIIDLSRRAAQLLGFLREGTVPVRVEIIEDESRFAAVKAQGLISRATAVPSGEVMVTSLATDDRQSSAPDIAKKKKIVSNKAGMLTKNETILEQTQIPSSQKIFIQAGAFINRHRADVLKYLLEKYGQTSVVNAKVGQQQFYRVRIGPLASVKESDNILEKVVRKGYPNAQVVID
ncbi:MAG: RlpA-like double-psi beta-barrel domain-containing protein, partial [Rhodospirillaceae bacterium]